MEYRKGQPAIAVSSSSGGAVSIVGSQFCLPTGGDLGITVSSRSRDGFRGFIVSDPQGAVFLRVKLKSGGFFSKPKQLVEDASGNTLLTLQPKSSSSHYRQRAFKGSSTDPSDMLFSAKVKRFRWNTSEFDVFLAANTEEKAPDFKVISRSGLKECTLYSADDGSHTSPLAKMTKDKKPFQLCGSVKDSWRVYLAPHADYAFVVTLFVMLFVIEASRRSSGVSASTAAATGVNSGFSAGDGGGGGGGC